MSVMSASPDEPLACATCGVVVADAAVHAAWNHGQPPPPISAGLVAADTLAEEITFALRRIKRGGAC